jgi:hypothetical protein
MTRLRWTLPVLAALLAGCGGSRSASPAASPIDQSVKSTLERTMMTAQPRTEHGSSWSTHVRRVRCAAKSPDEFTCEVTFMNGTRRRVTALEHANGVVSIG